MIDSSCCLRAILVFKCSGSLSGEIEGSGDNLSSAMIEWAKGSTRGQNHLVETLFD